MPKTLRSAINIFTFCNSTNLSVDSKVSSFVSISNSCSSIGDCSTSVSYLISKVTSDFSCSGFRFSNVFIDSCYFAIDIVFCINISKGLFSSSLISSVIRSFNVVFELVFYISLKSVCSRSFFKSRNFTLYSV